MSVSARLCAVWLLQDVNRFQKHINDVANVDNLQLVLFQHGAPLRDVELLSQIVVSRNPLYLVWPFSR